MGSIKFFDGWKFEQDGKVWDLLDLPDGFVIEGNVYLNYASWEGEKLPNLSHVTVKGFFSCAGSPNLISLENCPICSRADFSNCPNLTSLKGVPPSLKELDLHGCENLSLDDFPKEFKGTLICDEKLARKYKRIYNLSYHYDYESHPYHDDFITIKGSSSLFYAIEEKKKRDEEKEKWVEFERNYFRNEPPRYFWTEEDEPEYEVHRPKAVKKLVDQLNEAGFPCEAFITRNSNRETVLRWKEPASDEQIAALASSFREIGIPNGTDLFCVARDQESKQPDLPVFKVNDDGKPEIRFGPEVNHQTILSVADNAKDFADIFNKCNKIISKTISDRKRGMEIEEAIKNIELKPSIMERYLFPNNRRW